MELPEYIEQARTMFFIQLLVLLGFLAPVFASVYLAVVKGRGRTGRWLFVFVAPILIYTVLWVFTLVFIAPAYFILTWFTPAIKELLNHTPYWYPLFAWVVEHEGRIASLTCALLTVWLVRYLWPRWPAVLAALAAPTSAKAEGGAT